MTEATTLLRFAIGVGFILLGAVSAHTVRSARGRASYSLAAAFGLLGSVLLLRQLGREAQDAYPIVSELSLVAFAASGYFFLRFRAAFIPLSRRLHGVAIAAVLAVIALIVAVPPPPDDIPNYSSGQALELLSVILVWSACVGEPTARFWIASRGRPIVQRERLRAVSGGYGVLIAIVFSFFVVRLEDPHPAITLGLYGVLLALIPVLYVSLSPPAWLRRIWRAREEDSFRPIRDLGAFAANRAVIAERALDVALRMTGSEAGFLEYPRGELLAWKGMSAADRSTLTSLVDSDTRGAAVIGPDDSRHTAIVVPLESDVGRGLLAVVSGPFTPFFGSDEISRLAQYAEVVTVVLQRVALNESLRHETERYEALLGALSDLGEGFVVTEAGRCVYANEAYCRMSGYTLEELREMPSLIELCLPEQRDAIARRLRTRIAGGQVEDHYEVGLVTKTGTVLTVETAVKLLQTLEGPRIVAIVRDITFRKHAERALERRSASARLLKSIAVAANEATELEEVLQIAIDEVCTYTGWPVGHVYLPGDRSDQLIATQIWHVDDPEKHAGFMRVMESASFARGEGLPGRVLKSGLPEWIPDVTETPDFTGASAEDAEAISVQAAFGFPILAGTEIAGVLGFYTDESRTPDPDLLDVSAQIGTQLGRVAERMRADALTKQFIANAAHELRTPITTIVGFANVLANQMNKVPEAQLEEIFSALNRQSERLRALVNDLLDYTRLQQSLAAPELSTAKVSSLLDAVVANAPAPDGKSITTIVPDGLRVLTNRLRFDQILINLITNAYRYGGDEVTIEARAHDGFVEIAVRDDGPGVATPLIDHLFEPFARGADSAFVGGSGLGLAIVRLLARSQGGDVSYEPGESGGATFVVRLRAHT